MGPLPFILTLEYGRLDRNAGHRNYVSNGKVDQLKLYWEIYIFNKNSAFRFGDNNVCQMFGWVLGRVKSSRDILKLFFSFQPY